MSKNLLRNGGFEADWGEEKSHRCLIIPKDGSPYEKDVGNIFTPPGWLTWFRHDPGTWDQPEVRDAWKEHDVRRVHGGQKGMLLFTFYRKHDAGFLQQISVTPGTSLRLTAWAHAWSNSMDGLHPSDGRWSEGPGYEPGYILEGEAPDSDWENFTFYLGIDPTGGTNPFADTVVWGQGAHIYNQYAQPPAVEAVAQADRVTVFLRSRTAWPFKHNDAYWDDAELVAVGTDGEGGNGNGEDETHPPEVRLSYMPVEPRVGETVTVEARAQAALAGVRLTIHQPSGTELSRGRVQVGRDGTWHTWTYTTAPLAEVGEHHVLFSADGDARAEATFTSQPAKPVQPVRGTPRAQYRRTYVLLPPDAGADWALAAVDATWDKHHYTIGSSADDAGIGDLDFRLVIAVNPGRWPSDLKAFFEEHYPGVAYTAIHADTPAELREKLSLV